MFMIIIIITINKKSPQDPICSDFLRIIKFVIFNYSKLFFPLSPTPSHCQHTANSNQHT